MTDDKHRLEIDQETEELRKRLTELEKNAMYYSQIRYLLQELVDNPDPNVFLVTLLQRLTELTGGQTALVLKNGPRDWTKLSLEGQRDLKGWQPVQYSDSELYENSFSEGDIGYSQNVSDDVEFSNETRRHLESQKHSNLMIIPVKGQTPLVIEILEVTYPENIPRYIDEIKEFVLPLALTIQYAMVVRARDEAQEQLQAVNKELEAFSYSVSHDLRAPLRGLDGFSTILLEKYSDVLDEKGKHYLQRIQKASQRMSDLIEALLRLSRVTRAEIQPQVIDLSAISREIVSELQESEPERQVQFVIQKDLLVSGDEKLIRGLMTNLLDNAWKFTSKHLTAKIEVGMTTFAGIQTYFVRDDGAGFQMEYAEKLFTPFHRLHSPAEFEGTGVGLATVQRIISRHGGTIWAESTVEEGATFYFTLDRSQS